MQNIVVQAGRTSDRARHVPPVHPIADQRLGDTAGRGVQGKMQLQQKDFRPLDPPGAQTRIVPAQFLRQGSRRHDAADVGEECRRDLPTQRCTRHIGQRARVADHLPLGVDQPIAGVDKTQSAFRRRKNAKLSGKLDRMPRVIRIQPRDIVTPRAAATPAVA